MSRCFVLFIFSYSIFTSMYINNMKVGREPPQHLIVSVLGSCCLKNGSSLGFFPVHMAPCGGRVLTQWLVYRSTAAARVSFPQRSPVLSKRILAVKFILVHECGDTPFAGPRLQYTVYDTGEISFRYTILASSVGIPPLHIRGFLYRAQTSHKPMRV